MNAPDRRRIKTAFILDSAKYLSFVLAMGIYLGGCASGQSQQTITLPDPETLKATLPAADENAEWTIIAQADFTNPDGEKLSVLETDQELKWSIKDGAGCFAGISSDKRWMGNHVVLAIDGDTRSRLELSGDFRIVKSDGFQLVALWGICDPAQDASGPLCIKFDGMKGQGHYAMQTRWLNLSHTVAEGENPTPGFGDEQDQFHKMRIMLDRATSTIAYFVDESLIGQIYYEGEIPPIVKMQMDIETPNQGTELEVHFKNLQARSSGPIYLFTN